MGLLCLGPCVAQAFCGPIILGDRLGSLVRTARLTNNIVELIALFHGLQYNMYGPCHLHYRIVFDSRYVAYDTQHLYRARLNIPVVQVLRCLAADAMAHAAITWLWCRGHSSNLGHDVADVIASVGALGASRCFCDCDDFLTV